MHQHTPREVKWNDPQLIADAYKKTQHAHNSRHARALRRRVALDMLLHNPLALPFMAWVAPTYLDAGDAITNSWVDMVSDDLVFLATHAHDGVTGGGAVLGGTAVATLDSIPTATANSAAWIETLAYSIPEDTFFANSKNTLFVVQATFKCVNGVGSSQIWNSRLKLGSTYIAQCAHSDGGGVVNGTYYVDIYGWVRGNESHDAQSGFVQQLVPKTGIGTEFNNYEAYQDDGTAVEVNSSAAVSLSLEFQNEAADASLSHQAHSATFTQFTGT